MDRYLNRAGNSGVTAYEIGADFIKVCFGDQKTYLYTHASAGKRRIERMKALARQGSGLGTYISQQVKDGYAAVLHD